MEALIQGAILGESYPESGPGPKRLLRGDLNLGYFGVVTDSEMGGMSDLLASQMAGESFVPYTTNSSVRWYKFAFRNKFLFFPSRSIGSTDAATMEKKGVLWDLQVRSTGTPATKLPPVTVFHNPGSQHPATNLLVTVDGTRMFVRTHSFQTALTSTSNSVTPTDGLEASELIYKVFLPTTPNNAIGLKLPRTDFEHGGIVPIYTTDGLYAYSLASSLLGGRILKDSFTENGWAPILEVTDYSGPGQIASLSITPDFREQRPELTPTIIQPSPVGDLKLENKAAYPAIDVEVTQLVSLSILGFAPIANLGVEVRPDLLDTELRGISTPTPLISIK